jgi:lysophospholipase L1-like esterase
MKSINKYFLVIITLLSPSIALSETLVAWGDSLTAGAGGTPWTQQFTSLTGITTINEGIGGQTSTQIADRFLSQPALFNDFTVIWVGQNNPGNYAIVENDIFSMVSQLTTSNYLVLGVLTGDYPIPNTNTGYESIGSLGYSGLIGLNSELANIYKNHFININTILVNSYNQTLPQDVNDFNQRIVPASLRSDSIHLNTAGYNIVANSVYSGYLNVTAVPLPSAIWLFGSALAGFIGFNRRQHNNYK